MKRSLLILFICGSITSFSQVDKIKVKKEENGNVCPLKVIIAKEVEGQAMKINSFTINDHPQEKEIGNSKEFLGTFQFLENEMSMNEENIKNIFARACSIKGYVLELAEVKKHITNKPYATNSVDIYLTYSK